MSRSAVRLLLPCAAVLLVLVSTACSNTPADVLSPTAANSTPGSNTDGTLLKVTAPVPTSPANNATLADGATSVQLQATAATSEFSTRAFSHRFEVYQGSTIAGAPLLTLFATPQGTTVSATATNLNVSSSYVWRVRAEDGDLAGPWSATAVFRTSGQTRRDASAFGGKIPSSVPLGDLEANLFLVARAHDAELQASCNDGRNALDFPTVLLQTLRKIDNRWGFNCRRGNCADPSNDVVDYHWGVGSSDQSTEVYIFDVIGGRDKAFGCDPHILDVTDVTFQGGTVGRWSLLGKFPPNNPDK